MISTPRIEDLPQQHIAAVRARTSMSGLPEVIPAAMGEVAGWLGSRGAAPAGALFVRYSTFHRDGALGLEIGWPVAAAPASDGRVLAGVLPAGRYAAITYTGPYAGTGLMEATKALLDWGEAQGLVWDESIGANEHSFASRFESYVTDPQVEPDPAKWITIVYIKLADAA